MEFASLNFAIQHIVGYMYKLEGYDQDWNISGTTNRATYSNVPIGNYTLHVKAFVGNADAADEGITIGVEVLPPLGSRGGLRRSTYCWRWPSPPSPTALPARSSASAAKRASSRT